MKKREISKLNLNKKQISSFNVLNLRGGNLGVETECEQSCDCEITRVQTCGTEKSSCIPCYSIP
ncbi:MAG: hypothetical protein AB8B65_09470 [Kordia sp.]|uniref:hypothetical protein n=1 Tax=Kordia sp. TaxID=1965332 RepID=UPI00385AA827